MWAEPCLLPTATSKLSGAVEEWLSAAERLYGPYMWGRYVLSSAPPGWLYSFPQRQKRAGLGTPCLTPCPLSSVCWEGSNTVGLGCHPRWRV